MLTGWDSESSSGVTSGSRVITAELKKDLMPAHRASTTGYYSFLHSLPLLPGSTQARNVMAHQHSELTLLHLGQAYPMDRVPTKKWADHQLTAT